MKDRIRKIRKDLQLTQKDFAKRIGVSRNTIATYETSKRTPIDAIVISICREFDISEEWLRTGNGEMKVNKSTEEQAYRVFRKIMESTSPIKRNITAMLLAMIETLSEEQWEKIYDEFNLCIERTKPEKVDEN